MWAAAEGHVDVVKALLAAGADPNRKAHVNALEERKHARPSDGRLHGADVRGAQRSRGRRAARSSRAAPIQS